MRVEQLAAFAAVSQEGSFTAAAHAIHSTQPTLTKQISALERELGFRLFNRTTNAVSLTAEGEVLLPHIQKALAAVNDGLTAVDIFAARQRDRLRIGCMYFRYDQTTPFLVKNYEESEGSPIELVRKSDDPQVLINAVSQKELDAAFVCSIDRTLIPDNLDSLLLVSMAEQIVLGESHPLAGRPHLSLEDLATETLLFAQNLPPASISPLIHELQTRQLPVVSKIVDSDGTAVQMARMNMGVMPLPGLYPVESEGLVALPYRSPCVIEDSLIWRKDDSSYPLQRFIRFAATYQRR